MTDLFDRWKSSFSIATKLQHEAAQFEARRWANLSQNLWYIGDQGNWPRTTDTDTLTTLQVLQATLFNREVSDHKVLGLDHKLRGSVLCSLSSGPIAIRMNERDSQEFTEEFLTIRTAVMAEMGVDPLKAKQTRATSVFDRISLRVHSNKPTFERTLDRVLERFNDDSWTDVRSRLRLLVFRFVTTIVVGIAVGVVWLIANYLGITIPLKLPS